MQVSMKLIDFGSLRALVDVQFEDMEVRGFKVIDNGEGPWVAMPAKEIVRDGHKQFWNIVRFINDEAKQKFSDQVLDAYRTELDKRLRKCPGCSD